MVSGSEADIRGALKADRLEVMDRVDLKENIVGVKPVHSKLGPAFRKDAKELAERMQAMRPQDIQVSKEELVVKMSDGREIRVPAGLFELLRSVSSDRGQLQQLSAAGLSILIYQ